MMAEINIGNSADQLANPALRSKIFAIADALAGGTPVVISSGGGGGNPDSDFRWDGPQIG